MPDWRPLLQGRDAERAWEAIDAIAAGLRPEVENLDPEAHPGVAGGTAGLALFYAYLGAVTGKDEWTGLAERLIEYSIDALSNRPMHPDLYEGFSGIAWATGHLEGMVFEPDEDDDDPIGESLLQVLSRPELFARGEFDLIGGLSGYGIYAYDALPRPNARRCLELLVERLIGIGEHTNGGFSWFSPPERIPDWQLEESPNGKFNLGVSHGVAAVISVLGMCAGAGVMSDEQRSIYDRSVAWMLAQKQEGKPWCFTNSIIEGRPTERDRLAWCYGDPGIAGALFTAARHAGNAALEAEALDVARTAAARPMDDSGVIDAGLCHGSAGLAHLFNRMYQASGDPVLADAARAWFRRTLDLRKPGEGIGGYAFWVPPDWQLIPRFVDGAAGVGLGLLGGVSSLEPAWDQFLAVSVPLERRT